MRLATFTYQPAAGWSISSFPELDSPSTLVLVFGGSRYLDDPRVLGDLERAYPTSHISGCSTAGEIHGTHVSDDTLSVAVMQLEHAQIQSATCPIASAADSFDTGAELARELAGVDLRGIFVLSDGLRVNGSELVRGISSVLPAPVPVTGGLAGDGANFKQTWTLSRGGPRSGSVSMVGFYGDRVHMGHGSQGGWDAFGPERLVTRAEGNVLYELDGRPALALYREYLGERAAGLPATALLFPLALRRKRGDENTLVRTVLSVDNDANSMTFAGDIPVGSLAQLMRANFDRLVDGAHGAAMQLPTDGTGSTLAVAISCVGRRLVLGERTEEEVEATLGVLPAGTRQVGFYSYGEISPISTGACDLHNQTMTLTTFSES